LIPREKWFRVGSSVYSYLQTTAQAGNWWLILVILATQKAKINIIKIGGQAGGKNK
jgi:hypothetical protein